MPAPASRIVPRAVAANRRPVEDRFDAAANATRCLSLQSPYGFKDPNYVGQRHIANEQLSDHGRGVLIQGVSPLLRVFGVAPLCRLGTEIFSNALVEGLGRRCGRKKGALSLPALQDRVNGL